MLPPATRVLSRVLAASSAVLLCACATLGPEPAHAVMCPVTVHFENRTGYLFRLAIDDMPVRSIARGASTANYRFAYRGASDGLCHRTSVELTARAVRQNGAPGWFVPLVNADGGSFQYRVRAQIQPRPVRGVTRRVPFFGVAIADVELEGVASVSIDDMTVSEPVEVSELELLLRQTARLEADLDRSRREIAGYQATVRQLGERIVAEHAARVGAERDLETARALLAEADARNVQLEAQVRADLERGRLTPSAVQWAVQTTAEAVRAHRGSLCSDVLRTGGDVAIDLAESIMKLSPYAQAGIKILRWGIGRFAGEYVDELVNGVCSAIG